MADDRRPVELPAGVLSLLHHAVLAGALGSVESMALILTQTGWDRSRGSGSWGLTADTSWTVESIGRPQSLSVFVRASDEEQGEATTALHALLDAGRAGRCLERPLPGAGAGGPVGTSRSR